MNNHTCLVCHKALNLKYKMICDNDCGTYICPYCNSDMYVNKENDVVVGHHPNCGKKVVDHRPECDPNIRTWTDQFTMNPK